MWTNHCSPFFLLKWSDHLNSFHTICFQTVKFYACLSQYFSTFLSCGHQRWLLWDSTAPRSASTRSHTVQRQNILYHVRILLPLVCGVSLRCLQETSLQCWPSRFHTPPTCFTEGIKTQFRVIREGWLTDVPITCRWFPATATIFRAFRFLKGTGWCFPGETERICCCGGIHKITRDRDKINYKFGVWALFCFPILFVVFVFPAGV